MRIPQAKAAQERAPNGKRYPCRGVCAKRLIIPVLAAASPPYNAAALLIVGDGFLLGHRGSSGGNCYLSNAAAPVALLYLSIIQKTGR